MALTKSQVRGHRPKIKEFEHPGLEECVCLRRLSGSERDEWDVFLQSHLVGDGPTRKWDAGTRNIRATLVAKCLCDPNGVRLFDDKEIADLGTIDGEILDALYEASREWSGLGGKAREEAGKNSEAGPSESSGTA